ncbi:MAG: glycosyltransferase [Dongiaceae bacterium]
MTGAIIALAALSLVAWAYLLVLRGGFWRLGERLDPGAPAPPSWPEVVAVVPARDEAPTIAACLESLLAQDYAGRLSVVLVDDNSSDGTGAIASRIAEADRRISVLAGSPLPAGWTGKPWALLQGVARAAEAAPDARYYFFTDADVVHPPHTLRALVAKAESDGRELVSLMVRLNCTTKWERLLIPAFVFFFRMLFPFAWVNDPARATAAAAGGCVLVRTSTLDRAGGLAAIRGTLIDDCALAHAIKRSGGRLWLGLAETSRSLRVYTRLSDVWGLVARTAYTQLRHSPLLLLATVLGMIVLHLAPPLTLAALPLHGSGAAAALAALAWLLMAVAYVPTVAYYRQPWPLAASLPVAAALYAAMTVDSALRHWRGQGGGWKGRYTAAGQ